MAMLPSSFNSSDHGEMNSYEAYPPGDYSATIVESDVVPTKAGDGQRLTLKFKIFGGQFDGRFIFNGLNIVNKSAQAVEISMKELGAICRACEKVTIKDSSELHNIPIVVKIGVKPATATDPARNTFLGYSEYKGVVPSVSSSAKPSSEAPKKKLWEQ